MTNFHGSAYGSQSYNYYGLDNSPKNTGAKNGQNVILRLPLYCYRSDYRYLPLKSSTTTTTTTTRTTTTRVGLMADSHLPSACYAMPYKTILYYAIGSMLCYHHYEWTTTTTTSGLLPLLEHSLRSYMV